jgi:hypothetical protein
VLDADLPPGAELPVKRHALIDVQMVFCGRHQWSLMSYCRSTKYKLDKVRGAVRKHCIKNFDTILASKGAPCFTRHAAVLT